MIRPRTMPGVLELLPLEQITFQRMLNTIREVYQRFGFVPIETPALELAEVLLTKTGGETERQVYFAQSTGSREQGAEADLALRFDLTVPLARYVAEHEQQLTFPFRRYQIQRVYRGESAQRGRFREFYQCDIDVIGRDELSLAHDAELPAVIHEVFTRLGIGPFTIRINNRKVMRGVLELLGVVDPALQEAVFREVDKIDKRGVEAVRGTLVDMKVGRSAAKRLMEILGTKTPTLSEAYAVLDGFPPGHPELERGIAEIRGVLGLVGEMGVPEERFCLDLSIARGLDYYTGTVYETTLDDHSEIGSICSGGRYDGLASHYTASALPGVGISIGLTRLFWQLREAGLVGEPESTVKVLVTLMDAEGLTYALDVGRRLREKGVNTEVALEPSKLGKQLKQASKSGIRYAVIAGENERAKGTVTVKDLTAETQKELAVKAAVKELSRQE